MCPGKAWLLLPCSWLRDVEEVGQRSAELSYNHCLPLRFCVCVCVHVPFLSAPLSLSVMSTVVDIKKTVKILKEAQTLELSVCSWDSIQDKVFHSISDTLTVVHSLTQSFIEHLFCTRHHIRNQKYKCETTLLVLAQPSPTALVLRIHTAYCTRLTFLECTRRMSLPRPDSPTAPTFFIFWPISQHFSI